MAANRNTSRRTPQPALKRITEPLVRDNGVLRRATWDEALSRAADGLRHVRDTYGENGMGIFSCSKSTNEMNFLAQKFARQVLGTNNIDSCNRT
jgi:formate dehydrogenase major subunit